MRLFNAKEMMDTAVAKGYAIAAINTNGGTYDITRAILEAADELRAPIIVQAFAPNLVYRGYDYFVKQVKHLAEGLDIPICISLDHGKDIDSIMHAVRAGFTHVMFDYAGHPIEKNIEYTNLVRSLVRPLNISLEAEIGVISSSADKSAAPVTPLEDIKTFLGAADIDLLAFGVGTSHGIFDKQESIDFEHIKTVRQAVDIPLVLHGTCGISMQDISGCVRAGMSKINFGEGVRVNYIKYFLECSQTIDHEHHPWRIMEAAKDKLKDYVKELICAVGSDGKA